MGMIQSMTGFGKAQAKSRYGIARVELRALNHKFFELSAKIPNGLGQYEDKLKNMIHGKVRRGKVYLNVELNSRKNGVPGVLVNRAVAKKYKEELMRLKKSLGLKGEIGIDQIMRLPGVVVTEPAKANSHNSLPCVKEALKKALERLVDDRKKEGQALYEDLLKRVDIVGKAVEHIEERTSISIGRYKEHLNSRIKELAGAKGIDSNRLEQEVAIFAKNSDVSEELVRLRSHLESFKRSLVSESEAGKKLDFIAQELHREANTVASKSSDFKISKSVIQVKSEIEKIREQVKNIE